MVDFPEVCTHDGVATQNPVICTHKVGNHSLPLPSLPTQTQTINISITQLHSNILGSSPTDFFVKEDKITALMG